MKPEKIDCSEAIDLRAQAVGRGTDDEENDGASIRITGGALSRAHREGFRAARSQALGLENRGRASRWEFI